MSQPSWWCMPYEELEYALGALRHPALRARRSLSQGTSAVGDHPHGEPARHLVPAVARGRHRGGRRHAGRARAATHGYVPLSARHAARQRRRRRDRAPQAHTSHPAAALAAHRDGPDVFRHPLLEPHRQAGRLPVHHGHLLCRRALPAHPVRHGDRRQPQLAGARPILGAAVGIRKDPHRAVPRGVPLGSPQGAHAAEAQVSVPAAAAASLHRAAHLHLEHRGLDVCRGERPRLGPAVLRHRRAHDVHGDGQPFLCLPGSALHGHRRSHLLHGLCPCARAL